MPFGICPLCTRKESEFNYIYFLFYSAKFIILFILCFDLEGKAERTVPALFTASESFDVGMDKGSGVAMEYHDKIPFKFNGKINKINIKYIE